MEKGRRKYSKTLLLGNVKGPQKLGSPFISSYLKMSFF
jgi:hypothetical protein